MILRAPIAILVSMRLKTSPPQTQRETAEKSAEAYLLSAFPLRASAASAAVNPWLSLTQLLIAITKPDALQNFRGRDKPCPDDFFGFVGRSKLGARFSRLLRCRITEAEGAGPLQFSHVAFEVGPFDTPSLPHLSRFELSFFNRLAEVCPREP